MPIGKLGFGASRALQPKLFQPDADRVAALHARPRSTTPVDTVRQFMLGIGLVPGL